MKFQSALSIAAIAFALASCGSAPKTTHVTWETLGNQSDDNGTYYVERFTVTGDMDFDRLAFNQYPRVMESLNTADTLIEIIPNYYCIASPRFRQAEPGDTVVIEIRVNDAMRSICYAPDGFHRVNADGSTSPVEFSYASLTSRPELYATSGEDRMPAADVIYDFNESLVSEPAGDFEVVPSFKRVFVDEGQSEVAELKIEEQPLDESAGEKYTIRIKDNKAIVSAAPSFMKNARRRAEDFIAGIASPTVYNVLIEDEPDFRYRGVMIDISRNFQTPAEMHRILDLIARYGFNHLHFHFSDDDAWRLDIPGLPELVEVGARRGYTLDDADFIVQIHAGDGNPDSKSGTANG